MENNFDIISVIIPVYKVKNYISTCIKSVLTQSYPHIEIILVDDCGNDSSIEIATNILNKSSYSWKICKHDKNKGLSAARNSGVKIAQGKYIFFLDSDDYLSPNTLTLLLNCAKKTNADMVFGNFMYDINGTITTSGWTRKGDDSCTDDPLSAFFQRKTYPMAWNRLINRAFYTQSKISFIENILHEDAPWSFSLIIKAKKISFVNSITYYYRQREGAITANEIISKARLEGLCYWLKSISREALNSQLNLRNDFKEWFSTCILYVLQMTLKCDTTATDKTTILNDLFANIKLPDTLDKQNKLFRAIRSISFLFPHYKWINIYFHLRNIREKFRK